MKKNTLSLCMIVSMTMLFLSSCGGQETQSEIAKNQQLRDSLVQVNNQRIHEMNEMMAKHYAEKEIKIKEIEDSVDLENERVKQEWLVDKKNREEYLIAEKKRQEEEEKERAKGPRWLDGTWAVTTQFINPFNGHINMVTSKLQINWNDKSLVCITVTSPDNDRDVVRGTYSITIVR